MIGHRLASASLGVSLCMAISGIIRPKHCAAEFWKLGTPQKNCSDEEQIRVDVRRLRPRLGRVSCALFRSGGGRGMVAPSRAIAVGNPPRPCGRVVVSLKYSPLDPAVA